MKLRDNYVKTFFAFDDANASMIGLKSILSLLSLSFSILKTARLPNHVCHTVAYK